MFYMDLHAHSSKQGAFLFGNSLDPERQVQNLLYAKLLSLNSAYIDYGECDFSEDSMNQKYSKEVIGKEGSGRVAIYRSTNIEHCYTVEMCYYCLKPLHNITHLVNTRNGRKTQEDSLATNVGVQVYNKSIYDEVA